MSTGSQGLSQTENCGREYLSVGTAPNNKVQYYCADLLAHRKIDVETDWVEGKQCPAASRKLQQTQASPKVAPTIWKKRLSDSKSRCEFMAQRSAWWPWMRPSTPSHLKKILQR